MPLIRVTVLSPTPGFYNLQFANANNTSIHMGYHGLTEARLIHELEILSSPSTAGIAARVQGPLPLVEFVSVDEATFQRIFAE
jgi:hypothetical protein